MLRLDLVLLVGLVVFALDVDLEVAPSVLESEFVATVIAWEASLALDLTVLVVGGSDVALESVSADAAFFLGGMVMVELVGVVVGWALVYGVSNRRRFYTDTTQAQVVHFIMSLYESNLSQRRRAARNKS